MTKPSRAQQTRDRAQETARNLTAQADTLTGHNRTAFLAGAIEEAATDAAGPVDNHRRLYDLTVIRALALALSNPPTPTAPQEADA